ncbi:hypothetical protein SFRURICE_014936 [Spodoptera frugiperda]|nr:hypothetical protein SFRURICE_014936 [Spodoptera frugiperda]
MMKGWCTLYSGITCRNVHLCLCLRGEKGVCMDGVVTGQLAAMQRVEGLNSARNNSLCHVHVKLYVCKRTHDTRKSWCLKLHKKGSILKRINSMCDPQIVVSGLGVLCVRTCMFVNAPTPTTQEKILVWGNIERNVDLFSS